MNQNSIGVRLIRWMLLALCYGFLLVVALAFLGMVAVACTAVLEAGA